MQQADLIWTIVSFLVTLLVFFYLFGDNPLFRLVIYTFVGVTAGYVVVIVVYQLLLPRLVLPLVAGSLEERLLALAPLLLSLLLLTKLSPRLARLGNVSSAYLVGAGAAVILGGAVLGTLIGQSVAAINLFDFKAGVALGRSPAALLAEGLLLLLGTVATLVYFQFSARSQAEGPPRRPALVEAVAGIGQVFIAITLGALFAGVYFAALTALIDRLNFVREAFLTILSFF